MSLYAFSFTDKDCKKKWKFIRDGYNRFKKKHKFGAGSAAPKNSKDQRHQQLYFLDSVSQHRSPPIKNEENTHLCLEDSFNLRESADISLSSMATNDTQYRVTEIPNHKLKVLTKSKTKDDDVDLFCRHIAEVLRHLPPVLKAEAKKHLHLVLSDYEIMAAKNFHGLSDCYASPSSESVYELPGPSSNESQNTTLPYSPAPVHCMSNSTCAKSASPEPTDLSCQANEESQEFKEFLNF